MTTYLSTVNEIFVSSVPIARSIDGPVAIKSWLQNVTQALPVLGEFAQLIPVGSVFHRTAIDPNASADVLVVSEFYAQLTPQRSAEQLNRMASGACDGQSVLLSLNKLGAIRLIPAVTTRDEDGFRIPSTPHQWIEATPVEHEIAIQNLHAVGHGIIRTFKTWNIDYDVGLCSFEIEALALRAFASGDDQAPLCFVQLWDYAAELFDRENKRFCRDMGQERFDATRARFRRACAEAHTAWFLFSFDPETNARPAMLKFARILDESLFMDALEEKNQQAK